jgi:hypothetical protein
MTRRRSLGAILLLTFAMLVAPAARSQEAMSVEQLKAAFLYNFVRFVEWPTNALGADSTPLTIGVIGGASGDKFATELASLLKEKKAHNHPLVVKKFSNPSDAASCQVVFVADGDSRRAAQVIEATKGKPILLIGEADDFLDNGGMISIVQDEKQKKLTFDTNAHSAEQVNLSISSHLLRLARENKKPKKAGGAE